MDYFNEFLYSGNFALSFLLLIVGLFKPQFDVFDADFKDTRMYLGLIKGLRGLFVFINRL